MCCSGGKLRRGKIIQIEKLCAGYMTVEATLVLAVVFWTYLWLIRSFLWMYDRCLLEQEVASFVIQCTSMREGEQEAFQREALKNWDEERYLWIKPQEPTCQKKGWKFRFEGRGIGGQMGDCHVAYEVWKLCPEDWLRMRKKIDRGGNTK